MWPFLSKLTRKTYQHDNWSVLVICIIFKNGFPSLSTNPQKAEAEKKYSRWVGKKKPGETIQSYPYTLETVRSKFWKNHKPALNPNSANCWTVSTYSFCILWHDMESCFYTATQTPVYSSVCIIFASFSLTFSVWFLPFSPLNRSKCNWQSTINWLESWN